MALRMASSKPAALESLWFRIGPWEYTARIPVEPIIQAGVERMGLCRELEREILLSRRLADPAARLSVLIHELTHAWVYHTGEPAELEDWCDLNATVLVAAIQDLGAQGGTRALANLRPAALQTIQKNESRILNFR